jgi:hypothetical protein
VTSATFVMLSSPFLTREWQAGNALTAIQPRSPPTISRLA